eukprot:gene14617-16131_t
MKRHGEQSQVYTVEPEYGKGRKRTLHRNLLMPCDSLPVTEMPEPQPRTQSNRARRNSPTANVPDSLPNDGESVLNSSNLAREIGSERTDDREGVPAKEPATQDLSPSAPSFAPSTPTAIEGPPASFSPEPIVPVSPYVPPVHCPGRHSFFGGESVTDWTERRGAQNEENSLPPTTEEKRLDT